MKFKLSNIEKYRGEKTQTEMGAAAGMNQGTFSRKERGEGSFKICELEAIATKLDIDLSAFFEFDGTEFNSKGGDGDMEIVKKATADLIGRVTSLETEIKELKKMLEELKKSLASHRHTGSGSASGTG